CHSSVEIPEGGPINREALASGPEPRSTDTCRACRCHNSMPTINTGAAQSVTRCKTFPRRKNNMPNPRREKSTARHPLADWPSESTLVHSWSKRQQFSSLFAQLDKRHVFDQTIDQAANLHTRIDNMHQLLIVQLRIDLHHQVAPSAAGDRSLQLLLQPVHV